MNSRKTGAEYEERAVLHLKQRGYVIVERNYRDRAGEIDIIAKEGEVLVFLEVKYRQSLQMGDPAEAVHFHKQRRIRNTARRYLYSRRLGEDIPCRFDVVAILGQEIRLIKNAF